MSNRWLLALTPCLLGACASLSNLPEAQPSFAASPAEDGAIAAHGARLKHSLPQEESAYWLLDHNAESLSVRLALVDLAHETLDIQYFIWQDDMTGKLLMQHVLEAADRGVRVRFFIDDLTLAGRGDEFAGLDAHPSIEVRVFNPWTQRSRLGRPAEFVFRSRLLNHRMHNKILVADGWFGVLGGRNIGDRYFGVNDTFVQNDIDIMVAGPVLDEMVQSFDLYWNHELAHPVFWPVDDNSALLAELRAQCDKSTAENRRMLSAFAVPEGGWEDYFEDWMRRATHGPGELLLDSPDVYVILPTQLYERFKEVVSSAESEIVLSSPYLIPDREFIAQIERLVERGVKVQILTNSLASNSHIIAHSAYKKWRRAVLRTGAELYEMRADAEVLSHFTTPPADPQSLALHTKAVVIDRRWTFVGSPNIDPRSMILNTEIGIVANDPQLAEKVLDVLDRDMQPENSWRVTLDANGWLKWSGGDEQLDRQPARDFRQRAIEFFMNLIPIKKLA